MGCTVEFNPDIRFNFTQNHLKQKTLIDAILQYSKVDIRKISQILDTNLETINNVHLGKAYLDTEIADELGRLFLILFSD